MRILNVTQSYYPFLEFGGPPVKVRALSEALAKRGHQVTVLTADWGLESRGVGDAEAGHQERSEFGWRVARNGVEATYLPIWLRFRALSWNPGIGKFCRARLRDFDVAHIFGLYDFLGPAVAKACRENGTPYVVEPIGMFVPIVRNFRLKRMYHAVLGQPMLSGTRAIVATSEQEVAELCGAGIAREKIVVRRNGVEAPAALPECGKFRGAHGIAADAKLILFLGRLSEKKSPDLLLQAFAMISRGARGGNLRLVFAGPDEGMKKRLTQMAERLGVASRVLFCGPLFGEAKWAAYRDANVFVLPSQNENFGNSAAEAVAAGTPVLVTDRCGIAPLLENVAGLVVAHEAAAIARGLERMVYEPGLHSRLADGCRTVAAGLDWDRPAAEMETLYARLAGDGMGGARDRN
jgi:glycosyltransferase involved in cell wall biosynthesis